MPKFRKKPSGTAITSCVRDITSANNDPRKWGLGTANITAKSRDANNCVENGWYVCDVNTPTGAWWYVFTVANYTNAIIVQKAWYYNGGKVIECMRLGLLDASIAHGEGWQPWEYVNPPMNLGVEYRTTERYLGKPVYCKVVDCGNLPNTTSKKVAHGIANVAYMIDVTLQGLNASSFTHNANELTVWANYECVYIKTLNDLSGYSVYASLRYTKTTD